MLREQQMQLSDWLNDSDISVAPDDADVVEAQIEIQEVSAR